MRADGKPVNVAGAVFFGALGVAALGAAALCGYEAYSLARDQEPITQRTRYAIAHYPEHAMVAVLGLGMLLGHLIWGPKDTGQEFWQ